MKPYREAKAEWLRSYLTEVLAEAGGKRTKAARLAEVHRSHFINLMHRSRLNVPRAAKANRGNTAWQALKH